MLNTPCVYVCVCVLSFCVFFQLHLYPLNIVNKLIYNRMDISIHWAVYMCLYGALACTLLSSTYHAPISTGPNTHLIDLFSFFFDQPGPFDLKHTPQGWQCTSSQEWSKTWFICHATPTCSLKSGEYRRLKQWMDSLDYPIQPTTHTIPMPDPTLHTHMLSHNFVLVSYRWRTLTGIKRMISIQPRAHHHHLLGPYVKIIFHELYNHV